jgi:gamma-glutamylcyclotransferase (GGCT)/AIG2-like uncharacterized protein YtfP
MSKSFATEAFPHLLMVYGTLKSSRSNNSIIAGRGRNITGQLVGSCLTHDPHVMAGLAVWRADGGPLVVRGLGPDSVVHHAWGHMPPEFVGRVRGELWRVNDAGLAACDRLEGHPFGWCRSPVKVTLENIMHDGPIDAQIYLYASHAPHAGALQAPDEAGILENKDWRQIRTARKATRYGGKTYRSERGY